MNDEVFVIWLTLHQAIFRTSIFPVTAAEIKAVRRSLSKFIE